MAFSLESISSNAVIRAPRILVIGVEKIGKSSFACGSRYEGGVRVESGINKPVVLPIKGEEGIDDLGVPSFPTIESFPDAMSALEELYTRDHPYETVVLDSLSALERLIWKHLCKVFRVDSIEKIGGGYGKGYAEAGNEFDTFLAGLDSLRKHKNMSVMLIAHVKVKRFDDPEGDAYDRYDVDLHSTLAEMTKRWVDAIVFANTKTVVRKEDTGFNKEKSRGIDATGGQRFIYTQKRPAHPGGGRGVYGELPYELPLDYSVFEAEVGKLIQARKQKREAVK